MKFTLFSEGQQALADLACDLLAIPLAKKSFNESAAFNAMNQRLEGALSRIAEEELVQGKTLQTLVVHTHGKVAAKRVMLVGTGDGDNVGDLRHAAAKAARAARGASATKLAFALPEKLRDERAAQFVAEGVLLGK